MGFDAGGAEQWQKPFWPSSDESWTGVPPEALPPDGRPSQFDAKPRMPNPETGTPRGDGMEAKSQEFVEKGAAVYSASSA